LMAAENFFKFKTPNRLGGQGLKVGLELLPDSRRLFFIFQ